MRPEILQMGPLLPDTTQKLEALYQVHRYDLTSDKSSLLDAIAPRVTAIATRGDYALDAELMESLPHLRLIASSGAGYNGIEIAAAHRLGIAVTNTPGVVSECVADLAWAMILAVVRKVVVHDNFVRGGAWLNQKPELVDKVWGENIGIVGLGGIGNAIARRAEAFRMQVAYSGRTRKDAVEYDYFDNVVDLAGRSRILVVSVPGSDTTRHLIGPAVIDALGPNGYLINLSRGSVVDEQYLVGALASGRLKGAGLDVFENEPHVPADLVALSNVILQPHVGSGSNYTRNAMGQMLLDNLSAFFAGRPPVSAIVP